jgi:hypothetical protein
MPDLHTDDEPMIRKDLFAQPFAAYIVRSTDTDFDLSFLSDTEYESLMKWLYAAGWGLLKETRTAITVDPEARLPPRIWIGSPTTPGATTVRTKPRRQIATIPRFCRHGPTCPDKGTCCHYTHEDIIACIDKPCGFDKPAEGKCCSGEKRRTCIRIHPSEGEVWTPDLVVCRPH